MDYWNAITKIHEHEKGESKESCPNCEAERLARQLTEFELFSLAWFRENVNQFAFDAHLISELIKELGLTKVTKTLFLQTVNMVYLNDSKISEAKSRKEMEK